MGLFTCARRAVLVSAIGVGLVASAAAQAIENTVVYLECTVDGKTSRGTGVLVSKEGHVLTAKHVIPDGATCSGSMGVADANIASRMVIRPTNAPVDAALLQFSQPRDYPFMGYCQLDRRMIRQEILIAGFPGRTETGVVSYRQGILSTIFPNGQDILETDAQSVAGMSGGPVYSKDLNGIVGIVIGAQFTPQGTPEYYGILPVETVANSFGLDAALEPCYPERPTTEALLEKIKTLETQLADSQKALVAQMTQNKTALEAQITQNAQILADDLKAKTEELDGKFSTNRDKLTKIDETVSAHAVQLFDHAKSLETVQDHPDRLVKAEGTLSEVEDNIEWSASVMEKDGSIRVSYKKIVSSGGGIDKIGLFVKPFYNRLRTDGEEGFINKEGEPMATYLPKNNPLPAEPQISKLGGYFIVHEAIVKGFINSTYALNQGLYHPDHPLTELRLTIVPMQSVEGGEEGEVVTGDKVPLTVRIPEEQWTRLYDNYLENAQNGS